MATDIFPAAAAAELLALTREVRDDGRPPNGLLTEDFVRRTAKVVQASGLGNSVAQGMELMNSRPWLAWVALVNVIDLHVTGFLFQNIDSYSDWEDLILIELLNAPTERPGMPPEWMLRRIARIIEEEFPVYCAAMLHWTGMGVEEGLRENPAYWQLMFLDYVNTFYQLP